jgi:hypothetical protein
MAIPKRLELERETFLENVDLYGVAVIDRKKFIRLGGGRNMSRAVVESWLESWRDYMDDSQASLHYIETYAEVLAVWNPAALNTAPIAL